MRIINVVQEKGGCIHQIDSFPIFEDQLSHEIVEKAENLFEQLLADNYELTEEEVQDEELFFEQAIDNGYFDTENIDNLILSIVWSNVNL